MLAYNVEVFTRNWDFVGNRLISLHENKEDYLSPEVNAVTVAELDGVEVGGFLRVWCEDYNCQGIIIGTDKGDVQGTTKITYKPYIGLLTEPVLFDCTKQESGYSLEQYLADVITEKFITNADTSQRIAGLSVEVETSTTDWTLGITPIGEESTKAILQNFYISVIAAALQKYQIRIASETDYQAHTIKLKIGRNTAPEKVIEADLKNVIKKNIVIQQTSNSKNKLTVYNQSDDFTTSVVYFLHPNGTYNTTDADRITPVFEDIKSVKLKEGETLADKAAQTAANVFNSIKYNNLIEIEVSNKDELVKPWTLQIGQTVRVLHDGKEYTSILTGRRYQRTTTLVFGTIRQDLTKLIGRRINNVGSN